jgi:hypothetical protein
MHRYPVAIGGVGGSGTRLIAGMVQDLGYYMGSDQNKALDNLWFTLLFKRLELFDCPAGSVELRRMVRYFVQGMTRSRSFDATDNQTIDSLAAHDRLQHPAAWLAIRAKNLAAAPDAPKPHAVAWGWKEPNTHIFMDRLPALIQNLRYIHVMRNGLDMALSRNQNQQRLWGKAILGTSPGDNVSSRYSLRYWCAANRRIIAIGQSLGPERFLLINFDRFCMAPGRHLTTLLEFLTSSHDPDPHIPDQQKTRLIKMVQPPASIGRYKAHNRKRFDPEDVAYVKTLGFDIEM